MRRSSRGDTLVEVLLGVTIFSLVAVITLETMNRGMAISQYALETTLVRQQVDAQVEILRYAHDTKSDIWKKLVNDNAVSIAAVGDNEGGLGMAACPDGFSNREFALAATSAHTSKISILNNPPLAVKIAISMTRILKLVGCQLAVKCRQRLVRL